MAKTRILVTGATGFIGSRLAARLAQDGYDVTGMSRRDAGGSGPVRFVKADAFDVASLRAALDGIDVAYYLLHSMEGDNSRWGEFAKRERVQAQNFVKAASDSGLKRIVYLGGLVNDSLELSPHMRSRRDVGRILASSDVPVTELRASLIIGAGGGSYAMLRYLVERLPVMVCPSWTRSLAQPVAVDDVIEYLAGCIGHPETAGRTYEIGGPEKMTYEDIMRVYAQYLGRRLSVLHLPFLTTRLSSYWVDLVTPVRAALARPLIDSLVHDTVVTDDSIRDVMRFEPRTVLQAIDDAARHMRDSPPEAPAREQMTGYRLNRRLLLISLVAMGLVGPTYYILDDRPELFEPAWLAAGVLWYVAAASAVVFVRNSTRLGFIIAAVLSWCTMAFWLADNLYLVSGSGILADRPGDIIAVRNFAWAALSAVAVVASHNTFHKIVDWQYRGRPA